MTKITKFKHEFRTWGLIFLSAFITAVALEFFLIPNKVIVGGASGIATLLDIVTSSDLVFSASIWIFAINIPIIIYFFVSQTRRYAVKAFAYITLLSLFLLVFRLTDLAETLIGDQPNDAGNKVMYTLIGGGLSGLAVPMMISVNSSTGGTDMIGLVLQRLKKKSGADSMRIVLLSNVLVVLLSSIVYFFANGKQAEQAVNMFVYSIAAIFVSEIVQETVFKGFSAAMQLIITTSKPQEIADALLSELRRSVTILKAVGGYSHEEKAMIVCVIQKRQLTHARRVIRKADSQSFAYVENVKEVIGLGFANKELEIELEQSQAEIKNSKRLGR